MVQPSGPAWLLDVPAQSRDDIGGAACLVARVLKGILQRRLRQPVVVEQAARRLRAGDHRLQWLIQFMRYARCELAQRVQACRARQPQQLLGLTTALALTLHGYRRGSQHGQGHGRKVCPGSGRRAGGMLQAQHEGLDWRIQQLLEDEARRDAAVPASTLAPGL